MDNKERFIEIFTSQIHRPGAAELLEWLESTDFFEAPASTHYHGNYPGGLVEHSLNVYYELIGAGRVPGVPTAETYAVVALLHDICKADFYAQSTRNIVKYYGGIPEAIKLLKRERDALEDEYNGLGGLAMDGMPHSSAPGNPTEALAVRVIENGVKNRLQEIGVQVEVLEGDAANIRGALDAVNGKYKSVIIMRLIRGYSWTKISGKLGVPDSTARNWHGRAVERLGEVLEEVPMVDELAERATRART